MSHPCNIYLDIETTGLSSYYNDITVIGIYREDSTDERLIQLVGGDATKDNLLEVLDGVDKIFTYNGNRFDIPFIHNYLGVNLAAMYPHHDLMYDCWANNLYGGLKAVERQLGIERKLKEMNGYEAVKLWWKYVDSFDLDALNELLEYNQEDVVNIRVLKERLRG